MSRLDAGLDKIGKKQVLAEGIRWCEAAERANVKLLVGHHRIHSPIPHKACEVIGSGILTALSKRYGRRFAVAAAPGRPGPLP